MYQELFRAVDQGATVLTGSKHLAYALKQAHGEYQRDRGRPVWDAPRIVEWGDYLKRRWRDSLPDWSAPLLLNAAQEQAVWESIIRESPEGRTLLRVPETAERANQAWGLLHAYHLPFRAADFSVSADCEAFFQWASEFESRCAANHWIGQARLSDLLEKRVRAGHMERPFPLLLAGFDQLTPQQRSLLDAFGGGTEWQPPPQPASGAVLAYPDVNQEMQAAAVWARARLEENGRARIGIAVPGLALLRPKLERIFDDVFHPGSVAAPERRAFHISLGPPLSEHPIIHAALLVLQIAAGPVSVERAGMLLRSPFLKGARQEQSARIQADLALRSKPRPLLDLSALKDASKGAPLLDGVFGQFEKELRKLPDEEYASYWARQCSRLLTIAGWPPEGASSYEYQAVQAWNTLLSTLATLDAVLGRMRLSEALDRLQGLAAATKFQVENEGAPVQIFGLEPSGLRFDHLWVMGLQDEALPEPARPNPFLPLALQSRFHLPHATGEWQLAYAGRLINRLQTSAPDVLLSYPQREGDQELLPSPLIAVSPPAPPLPTRELWVDLIHAKAEAEALEDSHAPELPPGSAPSGGTRILKDMADCPFRAYASYRLGAKSLDEAAFALDYRERGTLVHAAMEHIWGALKSHAGLCARSPEELRLIVAEGIAQACGKTDSLGTWLESRRLQPLIEEWLTIERGRPPFTVLQAEKDRKVEVGGLTLRTRIDRVDELEDGSRVVIDYKTGRAKATAWVGDRPDEPQVPLYCATMAGEPVSGAAFAQLRTGDATFIGVAERNSLGSMKAMKELKDQPMPKLIEDWRRVVDRLAEGFRAGNAEVNPKTPSTCAFCRITPLCRVRDQRPGDEDAADD